MHGSLLVVVVEGSRDELGVVVVAGVLRHSGRVELYVMQLPTNAMGQDDQVDTQGGFGDVVV